MAEYGEVQRQYRAVNNALCAAYNRLRRRQTALDAAERALRTAKRNSAGVDAAKTKRGTAKAAHNAAKAEIKPLLEQAAVLRAHLSSFRRLRPKPPRPPMRSTKQQRAAREAARQRALKSAVERGRRAEKRNATLAAANAALREQVKAMNEEKARCAG